jgi:hypothetical protein
MTEWKATDPVISEVEPGLYEGRLTHGDHEHAARSHDDGYLGQAMRLTKSLIETGSYRCGDDVPKCKEHGFGHYLRPDGIFCDDFMASRGKK